MHKTSFRIPTLVGLVGLFLFATFAFYIAENGSTLIGRASTTIVPAPENVTISKITDNSATISWTTNKPIATYISYTVQGDKRKAYDTRDIDGIPKARTLHNVEITNLPANTEVVYEIASATALFPLPSITTGPVLDNQPQELPVYGEVINPDGTPTKEALVIVSLNDVSWSRLIENSTSWVVPISSIRTSDYSDFACNLDRCTQEIPVTITIYSEEGNAFRQTSLGNARPFAEPIPLSFSSSTIATTPSPTMIPTKTIIPTNSPTPLPLTTPTPVVAITPTVKGVTTSKNWDISILSPKQGASLQFDQPLIRGEGVPGTQVEITVESDVTQIGTVTVDKKGIWQWTPGLPLEPGKHMITIKTIDAYENATILTRSFSVTKSGEQVLSSSTPSATLIPSGVIIPTPLASPTLSIPIITPTPTVVLPQTASYVPSVLFIGGGMMLLLLGIVVL